MLRHSPEIVQEVRYLRSKGKTYGEIRVLIKRNISKSTLSGWCKNVSLPPHYSKRLAELNIKNLNKGRIIALEINKIKREEFLSKLDNINSSTVKEIHKDHTAKIALAMLCLGEASKYNGKTAFCLGSSDPRIIIIFLTLLKKCFDFKLEKVRCTVQCRADQNIEALEKFWMNITQIPKRQFYKAQIDPRTKGKLTKKKDYKGVLRVNYFDTRVQLELESLANMVYNQLIKKGPEV